jgi:hypothetical protein
MTESAAATRGVTAIEALLENGLQTARRNLEVAEVCDGCDDQRHGDIAYKRAIAFMKVSAKLGMALAKLKGEHTSNVHIRRVETRVEPFQVQFVEPNRPPPPPSGRPKPSDEAMAKLSVLYDEWIAQRAQTHGDVAPFQTLEEKLEGMTNAEARLYCRQLYQLDKPPKTIDAEKAGQGDPPPFFDGSNSGK